MTQARRPPRLALWLAERCVHARVREAVVGDLVEAHAAGAHSTPWFWRQAFAAIARFPAWPITPAGDGIMTGFLDDLLRAARTLRRAPAFTVACAVTLGIAIGAATAIFSVADPLIIRPLPYDSPDRVYVVWEDDGHQRRNTVGYETVADFRERSRTLERAAAIGGWGPTLVRDGQAELLQGLRVSASYFATLGARPALGRDFLAEEDTPDRNRVVILSDALWRSQFGGDSTIVNRTIDMNGTPMLVAGVMPADFDDVMQPGTQVWRVLGYARGQNFACRSCRHLRMLARARPGVGAGAISSDLNAVFAEVAREHPQEYPSHAVITGALQDEVTLGVRPTVIALLVAVALLLAIATVNVGGLQLARAIERDEEFAVRTAFGASAGRLARQLLAEGLVVALVAGTCGWGVAVAGIGALASRMPAGIPRAAAIHLDPRAFAVAAAATILAGVVIGFIPLWHARRRALAGSLRGGRRVARGAHGVRAALVSVEVALAVVLLAATTMLARSLSHLMAVDVGVTPGHVATIQLQVGGPRYRDSMAVLAWQDRVVEAARAVPGVTSAAIASQLPLGGNYDSWGVAARDKPMANPALEPDADRYTVSADFLATMRIPVVEGRDFTTADNAPGAAPVVIVSRALARTIWPGESAIGKEIHVGEPTLRWYTVVGVAGDVHHRALDNADVRQFYVPTHAFHFADNAIDLVVRTQGDPAAVITALRRAVLQPEPLAVVVRATTMERVIQAAAEQRRLTLTLFAAFAGIAVLLATAGIVGVLVRMVAERRREIGVRSALGATPGGIVRLVVGNGVAMAALGAAAGVGVSLAGARVIESMLFGVPARDVVTTATVALAALALGVIASAVPAWRAVHVDPMTALRSD